MVYVLAEQVPVSVIASGQSHFRSEPYREVNVEQKRDCKAGNALFEFSITGIPNFQPLFQMEMNLRGAAVLTVGSFLDESDWLLAAMTTSANLVRLTANTNSLASAPSSSLPI